MHKKLKQSVASLCEKSLRERNGFEMYRVVSRDREVAYEGVGFNLDFEMWELKFDL